MTETDHISHQPIQALGWPSMTMDFPVAPSVDLNALKPGQHANFTLRKGASGTYEINSIHPDSQQ